MERIRVLRSQALRLPRVVMGIGLMLVALVATACSGVAEGNTVQGNFSGLSQSQADELSRMLSSHGGPGYGGGRGIHATGVGAVTARPDLAVLSLGVEGFAPTVAEARDIAAGAMQDVVESLRAQGIRDEDIQTQYFNIQPQYTYEEVVTNGIRRGEQRLIGYRVTNTLTVKVRDLDNVGPIIDGTVQAGGDATRVNNIYFTLENGQDVENQARVLALRDAVEKADVYARELGVSRGSLAYVSEVSYSPYARTEGRAAFDAAPGAMPMPETPINPGELEVRVTMQVVFDIN